MGAKCYQAMRRTEQRHSTRRIAKPPELSGLLPQFGPQFGTISMRTTGAKRQDLHTCIQRRRQKSQFCPPRCGSKYMEDVKAALSVMIWGSSITQRRSPTEVLPGHHQMPGRVRVCICGSKYVEDAKAARSVRV